MGTAGSFLRVCQLAGFSHNLRKADVRPNR